MKRFAVALGTSLLLAACSPGGINVYSRSEEKVGSVVEIDATHATVYDDGGNRVGSVVEDKVFNRSGTRVGRVAEDDKLYDKSDNRVGRVSEGKICRDTSDERAGRLSEDIDDEAVGGACLLLLLL